MRDVGIFYQKAQRVVVITYYPLADSPPEGFVQIITQLTPRDHLDRVFPVDSDSCRESFTPYGFFSNTTDPEARIIVLVQDPEIPPESVWQEAALGMKDNPIFN